jgi:hypothetical protein
MAEGCCEDGRLLTAHFPVQADKSEARATGANGGNVGTACARQILGIIRVNPRPSVVEPGLVD